MNNLDIKIEENMKIYNNGILIIEGNNINEVKEIIYCLLKESNDTWEIELLNKILCAINDRFVQEVA